MFKRLIRLALLTALGGLMALGGAVLLAVQGAPLVADPVEISIADIARARNLAAQLDLRRSGAGRLRSLIVSQDDAASLLNQAAYRLLSGASARVVFEPGQALLQASVAVPHSPVDAWLNLRVDLRDPNGVPVVDSLSVGRLPLPPAVAEWLAARWLAGSAIDEQARLVAGMVRGVSFSRGRLRLVYQWQPDAAARLIASVLPRIEHDRLKAYSDLLVRLAAVEASAPSVALVRLLPPMFALAQQRSAGGGDAAEENRAAILALAFYVNGRGLAAIVPAARTWARPAPLPVTLAERVDFPQHFLVSAAIAAEAGGPLADAIGLYKEVDDSRVGSGFSFRDIAADRAGTRFGRLAAAKPASLQARLAGAAVGESELIPDVADLPEYMPEAEFRRRFGGVGAPAYRQLMTDIDARIGALALYRR